MDGSFVREIILNAVPTIQDINGIQCSSKAMSPIMAPVPEKLTVHSLSSVVQFCQNELEDGKNHVVSVEGPGSVNIYSRLSLGLRQRETFLHAELLMLQFDFGRKNSLENFIISLQSQFVQDETTANILAFVGNITAEATQKNEDDGVTQVVTVKQGLVKVAEKSVPNPVILRPFRTFTEIEQPASRFVLRVDPGPYCALYEADGGAWENTAVMNISEYLNHELAELVADKKITILA